jgi:hypothetical protein
MPDAAPTISASDSPAFVEIARFHHAEPMKACTEVLEQAGVPFRLSDDSFTPEMSLGQTAYNASCMVMVPADHLVQAREALLKAAREGVAALGVGLEHPLATCDNLMLREVLEHPEDSSEYDIAVAEHLLVKRGMTPPPVSFEPRPLPPEVAVPGSRHSDPVLPGTRHADERFIMLGFIFGSLGGLIGIIMGCNYALGTEALPKQAGRRYLYDEPTRQQGARLALYSLAMTVLWTALAIWMKQEFAGR